jgi:hypothetical protein
LTSGMTPLILARIMLSIYRQRNALEFGKL